MEHVFNTLADRYRDSRTSFMLILTLSGPCTVPESLTRMWLYAAGLLLMDAVLKLNDEASPITVSSMYGLILNVVKVRVHWTPNDRRSASNSPRTSPLNPGQGAASWNNWWHS